MASSETQLTPEEMVAARMRQLRVQYLETMQGQMRDVDTALGLCRQGALTAEARAQLKIVAHKLAGTGATYGFPLLSQVARRLDDLMIADPATAMADLEGLARPLLAACREAQGERGQGELVQEKPADLKPQGLSQPPSTSQSGKASSAFGRRNIQAAAAPWPVVQAAVDALADPADGVVARSQRPLVLVADDDPAIHDLFGTLLGDDARIIYAVNSDEALHILRRTPPDLVLLDDIMPGGITGLTFLENLKGMRDFRHIPVVMITASDGDAHVERGLSAGAVGYITKPFDAEVVARWICNLLSAL